MALSGIGQSIAQEVKQSGNSNYYGVGSSVSDSGSSYNSVSSNYSNTASGSSSVADYNPYANGVPQSVIDAENEINMRSIPNAEYAKQTQQTIIDDYLGYLNNPDYQGTYTQEQTQQAYEYLKDRNNGANYTDWAVPAADADLFTSITPQWDAAKKIYAAATEQQNAPLPTAEQSIVKSVYDNNALTAAQRDVLNGANIPKGDWNLLSTGEKVLALGIPGSNSANDSMENAPWYAKFVQPLGSSALAGGAGAAIGTMIAPGIGTLIGFGTVAGLSYLQSLTGIQIPVINELLYAADILSVWTEQGTGAIGAAAKTTWDKAMQDGTTDLLELGKTMGEVLKDFPDLWEVGQLSYEVGADLGMDNLLNTIRNGGAWISDNLFGTDFGYKDTNTVSRANLGLPGLVDVNPETRGYDSLSYVYMPLYRELRDEAVRQGMEYDDAKDFAINHLSDVLMNYMGTTGLANDFAASAVFDPMNLAPYVQAKIAETVGKKTGDVSLQKAAAAALDGSSPIVDAFSVPGLEQIAEFITGKHATQGLDTIRRVYASELQAKPVDSLNTFQRRIANIDNNGMIKDYNHETNPLKRFLGLTEESKMMRMSETVVSFIGSILFSDDIDPAIIPEVMSEIAGVSPITDTSPLANYKNSALLNTMQSTFKSITMDDINQIQKNVNSYRMLNTNRAMVDTVADKLHMNVDQVFDALNDNKKRMELRNKMISNDITFLDGSGLVFSPEQVFDKIDVFSDGVIGRKQYSLSLLKADILETFSTKSTNALLDRYNIKPNAWSNRLSDLTKSVQSIALLNFSPSYFVNNFLNNVLTRSVVGVGGVDTDIIKTANAKRGLFYSREGNPAYDATSEKINAKKQKSDLLGKVDKGWKWLTDEDKVPGKILKGLNNADIETIEKRAAFEIGANRYWESTWKPGLNIPDLPAEFQTMGISPEMNNTIYKVAMDSNSLSEFKQKLMGDVILPGAMSTLADTIAKNYNETTGKLIKNMVDSMPWISERVSSILETGNPDMIRSGFQDVINEFTRNVDLQNIVQLSTNFETLVNNFSSEGLSAVSTARMALDDLYKDIWLNQTVESVNLFHQRVLEGLWDEEKFRPMYESQMAMKNAEYEMARKYEIQYLAAMITGLGIQDDVTKRLVIDKLNQFDIDMKYINEEHNLFMKYGDSRSPDYNYEYYVNSKIEMCRQVFDMKLESAKDYDAIMVQYLRDNLNQSYTGLIDKYESQLQKVSDMKADLNAKELDWLADRANDDNRIRVEKNERDTISWEREQAKSNIIKEQQKANRILQDLEGGREWKFEGKVDLDAAQTLATDLLYMEAKLDVDNYGKFLENYVDQSDTKSVFERPDFSNKTMEGTFVQNANKNADPATLNELRQRYIDGDAVPLGAVDLKDNTIPKGVIGEEYNPINSDVNSQTKYEVNTDFKSDIDAGYDKHYDDSYDPYWDYGTNFEDIPSDKPIFPDVTNINADTVAENTNTQPVQAKPDLDYRKNLQSEYETLQKNIDSISSEITKLNHEEGQLLNAEGNIVSSGSTKEEKAKSKAENTQKYNQVHERLQQLKQEIAPTKERLSAIENEFNQFLSDEHKNLDNSRNKKFDSFDEYKNYMKELGITLTEDNEYIPRKYQSEKYLSDLKQLITDSYAEMKRLSDQITKNEKIEDNRKGTVTMKEKMSQINDAVSAFQENEKNLVKILSTDDYYRDMLDVLSNRNFDDRKRNRKGEVIQKEQYRNVQNMSRFNYDVLLKDMQTGQKFAPVSDLLDSRPVENINPSTPIIQPDSSFANANNYSNEIRAKLDDLYQERDTLLRYKNSELKMYDYDVLNQRLDQTTEYKRINDSINKIEDQIRQLQNQLMETGADFRNSTEPEINNISSDVINPAPETVNPVETNASPNPVFAEAEPIIENNVNIPPERQTQQNVPEPEKIGTEYKPVNKNFDKSEAKLSMVRTEPFYHGEHLIRAGIYYDDALIAYASSDMPDTISANGYTFPVIGYNIDNPEAVWIYMNDEPYLIIPGHPNVEFSAYADGEHPMRYGTTPVTEPWGTAAWETSLPLRELLNLWRDESLSALQKAMDNGSLYGKLTEDQQKAINNWTDTKLQSAFNYQRFASQRYGNTMVDLALLNYNDRHGFDNLLSSIMPYQYWLTRSVMNWGARMIDQPKWFSMYSRLNKLIEKNKRDFLPTRLEGMIGIPMPNMPKGLGQGLYFDPFEQLLPFKQFYDMSEYFDRNLHTIHQNTISTIEDYYRQGKPYEGHIITSEEYKEAMLGKGEIYNKVFMDQRYSDETNTGLSGLVGSLINPNVLVSSVWKTLEAKGNSNGKDISYSPMYKLGNTIRSAGQNTAASKVFDFVANTLQLPDKAWRSILGLESDPIGSNWTDYWTVKYLSDMLYTKEHSYNEVVNAIAEGESNPLYQEAMQRYATSEAYKQQGGALLNEIVQSIAGNKETSVGQIGGTALVSLFGGKTYTDGEYDYRKLQALYQQIKDDPGMYKEFWNLLPEYKVGGYARYDDKEELLHSILVDNCNLAYYALPETQQRAVLNSLGDQFYELFINSDTRATDQIDNKTLIEWTRAMQGNVPNISNQTITQPLHDAFQVQWYADSVQGLYDRYKRDKQQKFPGIDTIEQGYFNSPFQEQYKAIHPELQQYWDWKESTGMEYPQLASYLKGQSAYNQVRNGTYSNITDAIYGQINNFTRACLKNHIEKGWSLPPSAEHQLKVAYTNLGVTIPYETWIKEIKLEKKK